MSKGSRFPEQFWHDIPLYPFSNTPDGRTVGELNRMRKGNEDFYRKSLEIQQRTEKNLAKAHGATIVQHQDVDVSQFVNALGVMTGELQRLYTTEAESASAINALANTNQEGFGTLHDDLSSIRGPLPKEELLEEILDSEVDVVAALGMHSAGILSPAGNYQLQQIFEGPLQAKKSKALREIKAITATDIGGVTLNEVHEAVTFLDNTENIFSKPQLAIAYLQVLNRFGLKHRAPSILGYTQQLGILIELHRKSGQAAISKTALIKMANSGLLNKETSSAVMEQFPEARKNPSLAAINFNLADILKSNVRMEEHEETALGQRQEMIHQQVLSNIQQATQVAQGQEMIHQGKIAIDQRSQMIQLSEVRIAQGQIAIGQLQEILGVEHRIAESIDGVSEGIDELVSQSVIANEIGEATLYSLHQIADILIAGQQETVDFRAVVKDYMSYLVALFQHYGELTEQLTTEIVVAKLAITMQLKKLESGLRSEIQDMKADVSGHLQRGNDLLDRLVFLAEESQQNKAMQFFRDGIQCLERAENKEDIEDAYESFSMGIHEARSSIENHFGAGAASQMLERIKDAIVHFDKAGKRAKEDQSKLASKAYEAKAKLVRKEKGIEAALEDLEKAIQRDPQNTAARYLQIYWLVELGIAEKIEEKVIELVAQDEDNYLHLTTDHRYFSLPDSLRGKILLSIWREAKVRKPTTMIILFEEMLKFGAIEAGKVFKRLLLIHPQILINQKIWLHPNFSEMHDELDRTAKGFYNHEYSKYDRKHQEAIDQLFQSCKFAK